MLFVVVFHQSAHLAMIDTLMMAYTVETVSVDKVTACIHQYSSCDPELETPHDTEDAVTTWINKVSHGVYVCHGTQLCHSVSDLNSINLFLVR